MSSVSRRNILKWGLLSTPLLLFSGYSFIQLFYDDDLIFSPRHECMFYEKLEHKSVRCQLCQHYCKIDSRENGICRTRKNSGGTLYSLVYALPAVIVVDPVEKEPQYHFLPGSNSLSIGTTGCNFSCKFCHNWQLSQQNLEDIDRYSRYSPREIVDLAKARRVSAIAFSFNEPTVLYEYVYDTAQLARAEGLKVIIHTNGYIAAEPFEALIKYVDAITVDLKGFSDSFYSDVCGGHLQPVLDRLKSVRLSGAWLEVVNLLIPGLNDDPQLISEMCRWIKENLGEQTPLHFSRFFPSYRLADSYPTPVERLENAYRIAKKESLSYVTLGNVPGHKYNSTYCPGCGKIIIKRNHTAVSEINIENGRCSYCAETIPGVWS